MIPPPSYGAASDRWRAEAALPWRRYTGHMFVSGLADGSLPRSAYLHYLRQDYVFLLHFSRAWALAIVKSETLEEMKLAAAAVDGFVNHEIQLHVSTCAAEGISEAALFSTEEAPENMAYTRYVLEAGFSGDWLDLMAALAPCVFGYGEIGHRLAKTASSAAYRPWIETYAGDDYQQTCHAVGQLIDTGIRRRLGEAFADTPRWHRLCERFRVATELEVAFWDMGLRG